MLKAESTTTVNERSAVFSKLSKALRVNVEEPVAVGLLLITPVLAANTSPGGRDPADIESMTGPAAFWVETVAE